MNVVLCNDAAWLLSEEAFSLYASCMYRSTYEDFKIQMEGLLNDPSVSVFVCEERGEKTGLMVVNYSDDATEIIGIAVHEKLRRRGIGRHMIRFLVESEGLARIKAQTDDDSVGFYRGCGFYAERIVVDYPDGSVVRYNCILNK